MGGVENPDTSLVRRLKHTSQYQIKFTERGEPKKDKQSRQQPEKAKSTTNKGRGWGGQVLKNLTRLWPGSSSTLTENKGIKLNTQHSKD